MKNYIAPTAALAMATALLGLQILGALEYTAGASFHTRAGMIGAMVAVAVMPCFVDIAWHSRARFSAVAMALSTAGFLWYSIPATIGRTGEAKEAKVVASGDVTAARDELKEITKTLLVATPDRDAECVGAPDPLPANGWPECKRKRASVASHEARRAHLEALIKTGPVTGDTGSDYLAWALSSFEAKADAIRKSSVLANVLGYELGIFGLMCYVAVGFRARPVKAITEETTVTEKTIEDLKRIHAEDLPELKVIPKQPSKNETRVRIWTADFYEENGRAPNKAELLAAFPDVPYNSAWRYAGKELAEVTA